MLDRLIYIGYYLALGVVTVLVVCMLRTLLL